MAFDRRDVRAVEGGSLENYWGASPRGFESLSLRLLLVSARLLIDYFFTLERCESGRIGLPAKELTW